jgi:hypothetical protein
MVTSWGHGEGVRGFGSVFSSIYTGTYPRMMRESFEGPGREMTVGFTVSAPPAIAYSGGLCEYWPTDFGPLFHRAFHKRFGRFGALRAGTQGPGALSRRRHDGAQEGL